MEKATTNDSVDNECTLVEEDGEGRNKDEGKEEHVTTRKKRRERKLKSQPKNVIGSGVPDNVGSRGICVTDFVQARAMELYNMTAAISQHGGTRRTFQTLPRHMRRRAMSHNIKRLPHRLREQAKSEVAEGLTKKLSRKTRRKPYKLVEEYGRRSEKCRWLESHIWHAKRFKMMEYHGYKIAEQCCDKGARATYRYLYNECLLYDLSYYGCVELSGSQVDIINILRPLMSKQIGVTIEAKDCLSGCRSGDMIIYHSHCYPNKAIGPVQFVWRPEQSTCQRQLWLIIHPAITDVLMKEINENIKTLLIGNVTVTNLQDELIHYKLLGPQSNNVIVHTVDPIWRLVDDNDDKEKWTRQVTDGLADKIKYFEYFSDTKSPAELPNKVIIGLTVRDFRLSMADKIMNTASPVYVASSVSSSLGMPTPEVSQSYIWNKAVRECVKQTLVPEYQLNKVSSEKLLEVSEELKQLECHLPMLLLHQTINGVGVGWDILVPAGWGKPLWLSLVYHGTRVIGFEEMKHCHLEKLAVHYPTDFPDTVTGRQLELNNLKTLQSKYCKYPPDKRPNFGKLNSLSPFIPSWSSVISYVDTSHLEPAVDNSILPVAKKPKLSKDESLIEDEVCYYVLRSIKCLVSLSKLVNNLKLTKATSFEEGWLSLLDDVELSTVTTDHPRSLVAVSFVMCHRGNPSARSMLCIPSAEDLTTLSNDKSCYGPVELLNKKGVCVIQDNEKLLMGTTSLTNKNFKLAKKEMMVVKTSKSQVTKNTTIEDFSCHSEQSDDVMAALKLQPLQPTRSIIGYVTNAGYVFSQGLGSGVGFCSLFGLMELMKSCYLHNHPVTILVREHDSLQYRLAYVDILQNHF